MISTTPIVVRIVPPNCNIFGGNTSPKRVGEVVQRLPMTAIIIPVNSVMIGIQVTP
jgi:hypothetical protein